MEAFLADLDLRIEFNRAQCEWRWRWNGEELCNRIVKDICLIN